METKTGDQTKTDDQPKPTPDPKVAAQAYSDLLKCFRKVTIPKLHSVPPAAFIRPPDYNPRRECFMGGYTVPEVPTRRIPMTRPGHAGHRGNPFKMKRTETSTSKVEGDMLPIFAKEVNKEKDDFVNWLHNESASYKESITASKSEDRGGDAKPSSTLLEPDPVPCSSKSIAKETGKKKICKERYSTSSASKAIDDKNNVKGDKHDEKEAPAESKDKKNENDKNKDQRKGQGKKKEDKAVVELEPTPPTAATTPKKKSSPRLLTTSFVVSSILFGVIPFAITFTLALRSFK